MAAPPVRVSGKAYADGEEIKRQRLEIFMTDGRREEKTPPAAGGMMPPDPSHRGRGTGGNDSPRRVQGSALV